jgi:hypothetical protein
MTPHWQKVQQASHSLADVHTITDLPIGVPVATALPTAEPAELAPLPFAAPAFEFILQPSNPCMQLDEKTSASLLHDAYHLNEALGQCTQVCLPDRLKFVARMHGVKFGDTCYDMGYTEALNSGNHNGVSFYNYSH